MKIDANKIIGLLVAALLAGASFLLTSLSTQVAKQSDRLWALEMQQYRLAVSIEIAAGGDPDSVPTPER